MARFLLRRLGLVLPALWLVSVLIFALAEIVPGDVALTILGPYATKVDRERRVPVVQALRIGHTGILRRQAAVVFERQDGREW